MADFIEKDEQGRKVYRGFLSAEETEKADQLLDYLQKEIPEIEKHLEQEYGKGVLNKYYLGKKLGELLEEYDIRDRERLYFWEEIKSFATENERLRGDGKNSKTRIFYEQCYRLSLIDLSSVEKLSWRQWQDILDRTKNREDERIFSWIGNQEEKIKDPEWRSFEKGLNKFLTNKDTTVFYDQELFEIYDSIYGMAQVWVAEFNNYSKEKPKSQKISSKAKWEKKYYDLCFKCRKANRKNLTKEDCRAVFDTLMK